MELFLNIGACSYKGDKVFGFWFNCKITDTNVRDAISLNKQIWWHQSPNFSQFFFSKMNFWAVPNPFYRM